MQLPLRASIYFHDLKQGLATSYKGRVNKLGFVGHTICHNYSTGIVAPKAVKQYINQQTWLCSNKLYLLALYDI